MLNSLEAIIVDDEAFGRENLKQMVERHCPEVQIRGLASNMAQAHTLIKQHAPRLIFLDIQMPNGTGFDLLEKHQDAAFSVVMVTAFAHYGIDALKAGAIDYVLKPIRVSELKQSVDRVKKDQAKKPLRLGSTAPAKISVPHSKGVSIVSLKELVYLEADNMYTTLHLANGDSLFVSKSLKEFERVLDTNTFFRVHKSYIINLEYLRLFSKQGAQEVTLNSGVRLPVSRRRLADFQQVLNNYTLSLEV